MRIVLSDDLRARFQAAAKPGEAVIDESGIREVAAIGKADVWPNGDVREYPVSETDAPFGFHLIRWDDDLFALVLPSSDLGHCPARAVSPREEPADVVIHFRRVRGDRCAVSTSPDDLDARVEVCKAQPPSAL